MISRSSYRPLADIIGQPRPAVEPTLRPARMHIATANQLGHLACNARNKLISLKVLRSCCERIIQRADYKENERGERA